MSPRDAVIVAAVRTPIGAFQGALSALTADEVIMGCVLPAGLGQAPARQAAIFAGLPQGVPCLTINKVCGSGLKAVMLAAQAIRSGDATVVVAGGMENMSQAPYLLPDARDGMRMGHKQVIDSMVKDGLWDVYNDFHMGNAGEICARDCGITREAQDAFATHSYEKATAAIAAGAFKAEIAPVKVPGKKGDTIVDTDEEPGRGNPSKFATLRPAFDKNGTITAANASSINDGAAAVIVTGARLGREARPAHPGPHHGHRAARPGPRVVHHRAGLRHPEGAQQGGPGPQRHRPLRDQRGLLGGVAGGQQIAELPADRVNVNGGAVALGHPIGASGCRILVTLIHACTPAGASGAWPASASAAARPWP
jgi:acetyl-CoA C-acetyltransferase